MHNVRLIRAVLLGTLLLLTSCRPAKELVVLLPSEDGQHGGVTIGAGQHGTHLHTPLAAARIDAQGQVTRTVLTPADVQQLFAQALAAEPPPPVNFTLYFFEKSTQLVPQSVPTLTALFAEVEARQAVEVQIIGHTDRVGTLPDNDRLSIERAQVIRDALLKHGLKASSLRVIGRGESEPRIATPDEHPEPRNRRVDVLVR